MDLDDVIAQIEEELTWRMDELRFLRNQLANIPDEKNKKRYRKTLIVMLYSYYEGFSKSAFQGASENAIRFYMRFSSICYKRVFGVNLNKSLNEDSY